MPMGVRLAQWLAAWRWRGWLWLGQPHKALSALDAWLQLPSVAQSDQLTRSTTDRLTHALATRAHLLASLQSWEAAHTQLLALVQRQPGVAAHWFNLGFVQAQLGQPAAAQRAFEQAIALSPQMDVAWLGLGKALYQQGLWEAAASAWGHQVALQPLCPDGLECLVRLHVAQGQRALATQRLAQLRSFSPRQALALEPVLARCS